MFMGEYNHSIDAKGRLIVPSKFREQLGSEFVVTKGLDGCLFVYSHEEWQRIEESLREKPLTSKDARKFLRFFFAGAATCEVDKQGRINLPANLREYAGIDRLVYSAELRSGARNAIRRTVISMIWMRLQNIWQISELEFKRRRPMAIHQRCTAVFAKRFFMVGCSATRKG